MSDYLDLLCNAATALIFLIFVMVIRVTMRDRPPAYKKFKLCDEVFWFWWGSRTLVLFPISAAWPCHVGVGGSSRMSTFSLQRSVRRVDIQTELPGG